MGMFMSFMGKELPRVHILTDKVVKHFLSKDINTIEGFHTAFLEVINVVNSSMPGMHFAVPSYEVVKELYKEYVDLKGDEGKREDLFVKFMTKYIHAIKTGHSALMAGMIAPPVAMIVKRVGERKVQKLKMVPDTLFVSSTTFLVLISANLLHNIIFHKKQRNIETEQGKGSSSS